MSKKLRQPTKAEREAEAAYARMMAAWDKIPKFARREHGRVKDTLVLGSAYDPPPGRESQRLPSRSTGEIVAAKTQSTQYTGDKVLGVATLHKSISQPVFSQEEAVEVAKMRRS